MLTIRAAKKDDFDFFYAMKSEDFNVYWTGWDKKPDKENLRKFFYTAVEKAGEKDSRKIYIVENEENVQAGYLYFIPAGDEYELSCAIFSEFCGRGYAKKAIRMGLEEGKRLGFKRMVTSIREDNIASMKAYTACGVKVLDRYREVFIPGLGKNVKMYYVEYDYENAQQSSSPASVKQKHQ